MFGSVQKFELCMKKIRNYQAYFIVQKLNLFIPKIFLELDFGLNSHDNSKTKYLYNSSYF